MPISPFYYITEESESIVVVHVQTPHMRLKDAELDCEGSVFNFECGCYRLRLDFPFNIDTENESGWGAKVRQANNSDAHSGFTLEARLPKVRAGPQSMDLLCAGLEATKLGKLVRMVSNEKNPKKSPLIQELGTESSDDDAVSIISSTSSSSSESDDDTPTPVKYGFKNKHANMLSETFVEEHPDVFEHVGSLDYMDSVQRRINRIGIEDKKFDPNRYMGDFYGILEDDIYSEAVACVPFWINEWSEWKEKAQNESGVCSVLLFEPERMKKRANASLTNVTVDKEDTQRLFYVVIDILFAYCFDVRCTACEVSVESATNITQLSSVLSWLEDYSHETDSMDSVINHCIRRGVCYPYLRNWSLIRMVLDDVGKVLVTGRSCLTSCIAQIDKIFVKADNHGILNTLFMHDIAEWLKGQSDEVVTQVAYQYQKALIALDEVPDRRDKRCGFPLSGLETMVQRSMANATGGGESNTPFISTPELSPTDDGLGPPLPLQIVPLTLEEVLERPE